jgi:hypothetical protein
MHHRSAFFGIALLAAAAAAPARADNIDEELILRAPSVMKDLEKHEYKNVAVLKFRVAKGEREPSFNVGLLNGNMATRLETALVLVNNDTNPVGITRDASQLVSSKYPKARYLEAKEREPFFGLDFPLAWGSDKVKVDAFLTGLVKINPATHKTTVIVELFDHKANEVREVANFVVRTDRSILSDSGESFSLVMRDIVNRRGEELEEEAVRDSEERNKGKKLTPDTDNIEGLVDLEVYYDDQKMDIREDKNAWGEKRVAEPREGQKVHFVLRNKTKERLGVVLRVNGISTQSKEGGSKQIDQYIKWVLEPQKSYPIVGYYLSDGKTVEKFKVERSPKTLGDLDPQKLGLIEVDVFRSAADLDETAKTRKLSLRGLEAHDYSPEKLSLAELKGKLRKAAASAGKKPVIVAGDLDNAKVDETEFKNPVHSGAMAIRYYP